MTADAPAYFNGEYLPLSKINVSPLDRGFLFGDGIYEVIPAFGRGFLDLDGHLDRFASCLASIDISNPHTHAQWRTIFQKLIDADPAIDKKVYVQVTRGVQAVRNHDYSSDDAPTIFAMSNPQPPPNESVLTKGVSLYTETEIRWSRCHLKTISLLPNVLLKHSSWQRGGSETLIVKDGRVVEGSASNVFAIIDGGVHTPPTGTEILPGITRNLIINLARELGLSVVERELPLDSVMRADEVWITSSTRGVVAATEIDDSSIGSGIPGAVWRRVYDRYQAMIEELRNGG